MTQVTIVKESETPSQQVIRSAAAEVTVTDVRSRTILLKKPGILAQYRLVEIMGDAAANETYMNMVLPVLFVSAIDGEAVIAPQTKREVEALIQRLDEDGIAAVVTGVRDKFGAQVSVEGGKAAVKK